MRKELLQDNEKEILVEAVVQLTRIADALVAIEETGVYVYQQNTEDREAKEGQAAPRRQG
jgi:hypothetical protein